MGSAPCSLTNFATLPLASDLFPVFAVDTDLTKPNSIWSILPYLGGVPRDLALFSLGILVFVAFVWPFLIWAFFVCQNSVVKRRLVCFLLIFGSLLLSSGLIVFSQWLYYSKDFTYGFAKVPCEVCYAGVAVANVNYDYYGSNSYYGSSGQSESSFSSPLFVPQFIVQFRLNSTHFAEENPPFWTARLCFSVTCQSFVNYTAAKTAMETQHAKLNTPSCYYSASDPQVVFVNADPVPAHFLPVAISLVVIGSSISIVIIAILVIMSVGEMLRRRKVAGRISSSSDRTTSRRSLLSLSLSRSSSTPQPPPPAPPQQQQQQPVAPSSSSSRSQTQTPIQQQQQQAPPSYEAAFLTSFEPPPRYELTVLVGSRLETPAELLMELQSMSSADLQSRQLLQTYCQSSSSSCLCIDDCLSILNLFDDSVRAMLVPWLYSKADDNAKLCFHHVITCGLFTDLEQQRLIMGECERLR